MGRSETIRSFRICKLCGKKSDETEFELGRKICVSCRNEERKANREEREFKSGIQRNTKEIKKRMSVLENMNEEARKNGMSYGQYVAWLQTQQDRKIRQQKKRAEELRKSGWL